MQNFRKAEEGKLRRLKTANPEEAKVILQTADPHTVYFHTHNFTHSKLPHYATGHTKVLAGAATPSVGLKTVKDFGILSTTIFLPCYQLIIDFLILYLLILSTFLFSGYLAQELDCQPN